MTFEEIIISKLPQNTTLTTTQIVELIYEQNPDVIERKRNQYIAQNKPKTEKENIVSAYNEFFEKYPNLKIHYKAILDYMYDANTDWEKLKNLKIHIAYLDSIRKHSLEKEIPWLYDILYNNLVL